MKIHIKGNGSNRLKVEEFITHMVPTCTIPEIGFGRGELVAYRKEFKRLFNLVNSLLLMGEGIIFSITKRKMCLFKMQSGITCYSGFMKKTEG